MALSDAWQKGAQTWDAERRVAFYSVATGEMLEVHLVNAVAREQILAQAGRLPDAVCACVGGGSNARGMFHPFVDDAGVQLIGVSGGVLSFAYDGHFGQDLEEQSVSARASSASRATSSQKPAMNCHSRRCLEVSERGPPMADRARRKRRRGLWGYDTRRTSGSLACRRAKKAALSGLGGWWIV